ncbi:ABC transporter substrate-binding protein [Candidatus Bipolaricaulota bacterium]
MGGNRSRRVVQIGVAVLLSIVVGIMAFAATDGELVVVQGAEPTGLDPTVHRENPTYNVTMNIFDSLLQRNADGSITPALAESFETLEDENAWIFHLRPGVTFHNGEALTADAVVATVNRIFDPALNSTRATDLGWIETVEVIDELTVKIIANKTFALAEHYFSELQIIPPLHVAEVGTDFDAAPIGTGPFKFVRWDRGNQVVLERNDDYWQGPAQVESVVFRFITSPASRVTTLLGGDADLIADPPLSAMDQIENNPSTDLGIATGTRVMFVGLDTRQDSPLQDVRVRLALNYAIDKQAIIENLLYGLAEETVAMTTSTDLGFNPDLDPYPYNPTMARQLLIDAGYPNGFEISMDSLNGRYINDKEVAQALAGFLSEVGITVNINVLEFGAFNGAIFSHTSSPMYFAGWGNAPFDASYVYDFIIRSNGLLWTIDDPVIDALINAGNSTINQADRIAIYHTAAELILEAAPVIDLYKQPVLYGFSSRLTWTPRSDEFLWMYDAVLE